MKLVITDCDHSSFDEEEAVAAAHGAELIRADARNAEELVAACVEADGIIVQYAQITDEVMSQLPKLRAIGRYGVGVDSVDVAAATRRGIAVCNVPDYGTESVSDHAIALAVSMVRDVPRLDRMSRRGEFGFPAVRPLHLFSELTFGVVGCGLIGSAVARKAAALGFSVIVTDLLAPPAGSPFPFTSLEDLLARSDIVSLNVPLVESTRGLIGARTLPLMKEQAILVNTSRGGVIDSLALAEALAAGRPRGAALDVLEIEPVPVDHPLMAFDTVCFTPHLAWYSEETYGELKRRTVENVAVYLSGERPRNIVNPEVLSG